MPLGVELEHLWNYPLFPPPTKKQQKHTTHKPNKNTHVGIFKVRSVHRNHTIYCLGLSVNPTFHPVLLSAFKATDRHGY